LEAQLFQEKLERVERKVESVGFECGGEVDAINDEESGEERQW
jgi:hypothetical protein